MLLIPMNGSQKIVVSVGLWTEVFSKMKTNLYQRLVILQICQIGYLLNLLWGADLFLFSYLPPYLFIFDSSSVLIRILVLWSLTGLMLNAHPLPFYEGQMHYFRLIPSYAVLWKMVRGLFNTLVCLLPAYSLRFLRGFHHSVFDTLYLEHLFLVNSPCCSPDGWRWMPAATGDVPYLLGWGCFTPVYQIYSKLSFGAVRKNRVNVDESLIKSLLFFFFPGEIKRIPLASGAGLLPFKQFLFLTWPSSWPNLLLIVFPSVLLGIHLSLCWVPGC